MLPLILVGNHAITSFELICVGLRFPYASRIYWLSNEIFIYRIHTAVSLAKRTVQTFSCSVISHYISPHYRATVCNHCPLKRVLALGNANITDIIIFVWFMMITFFYRLFSTWVPKEQITQMCHEKKNEQKAIEITIFENIF